MGVAYLYITHDLVVARYMGDRIAVMYMGKIVEIAETEELLQNPLHPYAKALLSVVSLTDPHHRRNPAAITAPIDPAPSAAFSTDVRQQPHSAKAVHILQWKKGARGT